MDPMNGQMDGQPDLTTSHVVCKLTKSLCVTEDWQVERNARADSLGNLPPPAEAGDGSQSGGRIRGPAQG